MWLGKWALVPIYASSKNVTLENQKSLAICDSFWIHRSYMRCFCNCERVLLCLLNPKEHRSVSLKRASGTSRNTNRLEPVALMPQTAVIHLLVEWRWWIYTKEELNQILDLSVVLTWVTSRPEVSFEADGTDDSVSFPDVWRNVSFLPGDAASGTAGVGVVAVTNHNIALEINWWEVLQEPEGVKFESSVVFKWWVGHHSVIFIAAATECTDMLKQSTYNNNSCKLPAVTTAFNWGVIFTCGCTMMCFFSSPQCNVVLVFPSSV